MPLGSGERGLPPVPHQPAQVSTNPQVSVRTVPSASGVDRLSGRVLGLHAWSTGSFTGSDSPSRKFNGLAVATTNRLRVRKVIWQMSADAAIAGGATTVVLQLSQNGLSTGIELVVYVPLTSQPLAPGVTVVPFDLGDGWVGEKGHGVGIIASSVLTTGQFRVILLGNEEAAD